MLPEKETMQSREGRRAEGGERWGWFSEGTAWSKASECSSTLSSGTCRKLSGAQSKTPITLDSSLFHTHSLHSQHP